MITKYRLVKYEADTPEIMEKELKHSYPTEQTIEPMNGLKLMIKEVNSADAVNLKEYTDIKNSLQYILDKIDFSTGKCDKDQSISSLVSVEFLQEVQMMLFGITPEDLVNNIQYPPEG